MKHKTPFEEACYSIEMHEKGISSKQIAKLFETGEQFISDLIKTIQEMNKRNIELIEEKFYSSFEKFRQENILFCSCFRK